MLSDEPEPGVALEPCDEEGALAVNLPEPCVVAVALVVRADAVRLDPEPLARRADVGHLPVAHDDEAWQVPRQVQLRVELDCALARAVARPVVRGKAERDGRAVDGVEGVVEAEAVSGGEPRASVRKLVEQGLEHGGVAPVHGVRERRLRDGLHAKVAETSPVGQKTVADLAQGVLADDLRVEAGQELPPGAEVPAVAVGPGTFDGFFETMSGMNWKSCEKMLLYCMVQGLGFGIKGFGSFLNLKPSLNFS